METAPLTLAHTHARNAVSETRKSNPVAASEEHDLAAGEFASAAQTSADREALRTLHLLESHHKKLAQILRFQHEHPSAAPSAGGATEPDVAKTSSPPLDAQQPPKLAGNRRLPSRESSSIASNLASARGIPSQPRRASPVSPTVSAQQAGAKMTDGPAKIRTSERLRGTQAQSCKERSSRPSAPRQPWSPPSISPTEITSQQYVPSSSNEPVRPRDKQSLTDEGFQRFYSTVEGLMSKLSAPLAFAGLPLGTDTSAQAESNRKSPAETRLDRHHATSDRHGSVADPDISKIFSKAALQAIRGTTGGGTGNTAESFYVVPTSGGTVSYAGILSRSGKDTRRNSLDDADDDFVDARETPASPELHHSFSRGKGKYGRGSEQVTNLQNPKSMEELQMENKALRHLTDTLSKRLHMWEVNAQSSSMALQQSLKAMHHNIPSPEQHPQTISTAVPSPVAPLSALSAPDHDSRIKELEEAILRKEKENEKLRTVNGRYRERWEKLKEGAKTRREAMSAADRQNRPESSPVPGLESPNPQYESNAGPKPDTATAPANDPEPRTDTSDS